MTPFGETNIGTTVSGSAASNTSSCVLTNIPINGNIQVIGRNIYRTAVNGSTFGLVIAINNNVVTSYTDTLADVSLGVAPKVLSTSDQTLNMPGIVSMNGLVKIVPTNAALATPGVVTCNGNFIKITIGSVALMASGTPPFNAVFTVTNNYVSQNSLITASLLQMGTTSPNVPAVPGTNGYPILYVDTIANGSFQITISNSGANVTIGQMIIYCTVVN